jgi:hypothetical protein
MVNSQAAGNQYASAVVADAGGNYVVVWTNDVGNPDPSRDIFVKVLDPNGVARTGDIRVNAFVAGRQSSPAVAPLPGGGFVVVWESNNQDGSGFAVVGRIFDSRGNALTGDFLVNTFAPGLQAAPRVSSDAAGNFVVVWHSENQDGSARGVFGRRFLSNGFPASGEFLVNTYTSNFQQYPVVSAVADGRFVVVWESGNTIGGQTQDGNNYGVFGRTYDAAGNPASGEFQINVYTIDHQHTPTVVNYGNNSFMAAWYSQDQLSFANQDVFARQYRLGVPGNEFQVNSNTAGQQFLAALDADEVGNVVAVWDSVGEDGSLNGIYARRYGGLIPWGMTIDATATPSSNGNRVFEPGEMVIVLPAWRNVNGAAQTITGDASAFNGPFGPAYVMLDDVASYGTVPNNTVRDCGAAANCYLLQIGGGTRPTPHWDTSFREDILPATQGQSKVWTVHVGDSFVDMPRTSPFYRFAETAFHVGAIPPCADRVFCRNAVVLRNEMAMFVLKSKEPDFVPPACVSGAEMFNDMPAANPYCRWVEELARRGVVAGCGGGSYCPTAGVTRQELAVYLLRNQDPTFFPPACGAPVFNDVPASSPFCPWVEELARRGVVTGCGGGRYCPVAAVDREQMSVFLTVTYGLNLYGP